MIFFLCGLFSCRLKPYSTVFLCATSMPVPCTCVDQSLNKRVTNLKKKIPICLVPNSKESSVRVLGVLFDQHLSLVSHVASLKSKLNKGIFGLNSMKDILDKERLLLIYNAHFHSHLNYCSNIFGLLSSTLTEQLFLLQKKL